MTDYYKFQRAVVCDGRECAADEVVPAAEIQAGTLETCLRMGHCVPCDRAGDVDLPEAAAPDSPDEPKRPKRPKRR